MNFHKKLFISEKIENKEEIFELLDNNIPVLNLYLICVCKKDNNMFDIIESNEYFKEINKNKNYIIIGLAMGKKDSLNLIKNIIEWWIEGGKNLTSLKRYFMLH